MTQHPFLSALAFGNTLATDFANHFNIHFKKPPFREENYFRTLIVAANLAKDAFAIETHGRGSLVSFAPTGPWNGRCELSDIALISFSTAPNLEIRLGLIQAKLIKGIFNNQRLKADLHQWDLLHHRPLVKVIGRKIQAYPPSILSSAQVPSIGSFLFFSASSVLDALYTPADQLVPNGSPTSKNGSLKLIPQPSLTRVTNGTLEVLRTDCIFEFGVATKLMLVGSPIVRGRRVLHPEILSAIRKTVSGIGTEVQDNEVRSDLLKLIGEVDIEQSNLPFSATGLGIPARGVVLVRGNSALA